MPLRLIRWGIVFFEVAEYMRNIFGMVLENKEKGFIGKPYKALFHSW